MTTDRIRHANPSRIVTPVTDTQAEIARNGECVTNPSRTLVTDSESRKAMKYIGKHTLSPSLYESVTYPITRCVCACARIREGGVMDSRDGFLKGAIAMHRRCDRCRFFFPNPPAHRPGMVTYAADGIRGGGECRRKPPTRQEQALGCFTIVADDWWCGEFEDRSQ